MFTFFIYAYAIWSLILSVATLAAYGWDKRQAKLKQRRIPEKTLHYLSLVGGWPGAIVGQWLIRHKTRKISFQVMTGIAAVLHVSIFIFLVYLKNR